MSSPHASTSTGTGITPPSAQPTKQSDGGNRRPPPTDPFKVFKVPTAAELCIDCKAIPAPVLLPTHIARYVLAGPMVEQGQPPADTREGADALRVWTEMKHFGATQLESALNRLLVKWPYRDGPYIRALITVFLSDVCLARIAFAHCFPRDLYNALPQYWLEHLNGDPSPTVYADMYRVYVGLLYQCSEHGEVPASAWLDYVSSVFNDVIFPDLGKDIVALRALLLEQGNGTAEAAL